MTDKEAVSRLLVEFRGKLEPLGVEVLRVDRALDAARQLAQMATSLGAGRAVVSSEVVESVPSILNAMEGAGLPASLPGPPDRMRDAPFGVSLARLAIAETGSMLLAEPSLEDRTVGMLTLAQVILCPTRLLVISLDDAVSELRRLALAPGRSMATLVTGPSRTADIERVLTVGVQGPGKVAVLFIDEL